MLTPSYSPVHTISWLLRKYPNPFATHVFSVDTLERTVDPDTGVLRSERVIGVQQGAPKWITKVSTLIPSTPYSGAESYKLAGQEGPLRIRF